jgi:hypothetical protein
MPPEGQSAACDGDPPVCRSAQPVSDGAQKSWRADPNDTTMVFHFGSAAATPICHIICSRAALQAPRRRVCRATRLWAQPEQFATLKEER